MKLSHQKVLILTFLCDNINRITSHEEVYTTLGIPKADYKRMIKQLSNKGYISNTMHDISIEQKGIDYLEE